MLQSPPCMVEKVVDRFRLGQKDRRVAGSPPIKGQSKLELSPGQKVRIELQGRAKTANILSDTITTVARINCPLTINIIATRTKNNNKYWFNRTVLPYPLTFSLPKDVS